MHPLHVSQTSLLSTPEVQSQIRLCMQETLLGPDPAVINIAADFAPGTPDDAFPDFKGEGEALDSLRKTLTVDSLMQFTDIDPHTMTCKLSDEAPCRR